MFEEICSSQILVVVSPTMVNSIDSVSSRANLREVKETALGFCLIQVTLVNTIAHETTKLDFVIHNRNSGREMYRL